jgi:hypothetical protein
MMRVKVDEDLPTLLRPDQDGIRPIIKLLERVLANYDLEALARTVTVVTHRGVRIRRARI